MRTTCLLAGHSTQREAELLRACRESYVRGWGLRMDNLHTAGGDHREQPYGIRDFEHDVARVLAGETPERCANWPAFA